ncbi:MAG: Transglycosylase SLT domain protein [Chloroflexi bacterium ADurb.Bin360]|nr:MAG: Transglycosylase SLT domain protein [Chloroflexi bacterium ADurb.Bin360]
MRRSRRWWLWLCMGSLLFNVAAAPIIDEPAEPETAEALAFDLLAGDAPVATASVTEISTYWSPKVRQWGSMIVEEAERRGLDPDFLASLVWMESRGDSQAIGPVGSVGLMQIMPSETGFSWRPSRAELLNPATNLFWGTRTLATVIHQGNGDVFNALAAYNGGWEQIMYRAPKFFATTILRDYVNAVALRHGLRGQGEWRAMFAVMTPEIVGPIWVADSTREDVFLFGDVNWVPEGYPLIPEGIAPAAIVAQCTNEAGESYSVGLWFYMVRQDDWFVP